MRGIKYVLLAATAALLFALPAPGRAQVSIGIGIGAEPSCPYGYYDYAPYRCSPYGYYGPEWFVGGRFVGAGGWYHGQPGFYGHVNHRFDPRYGYHGAYPGRGPYQEHPDHFQSFHGSQWRDGQGHYHSEAAHASGHYPGGHPR
jgi:hypothetical protein